VIISDTRGNVRSKEREEWKLQAKRSLRHRETKKEISVRRLPWVKLSQLPERRCSIRGSLIRLVALIVVSDTMTTTISSISHFSRTGLQLAYTKE
jgi:hypothetical protein